ncbi:MAG: hypothetical protein JO015_07745 [Verrucomicrobia bacterium]|nr:hypothetical protein [Verrucomicrobiota bacterium]
MNPTVILVAAMVLMLHEVSAQPAADRELLPDFQASVRFHFREKIPDALPGEKSVSAPSYETENLPPAQLLQEKKRRVIRGKVPDLPFVFYLRLTRPNPQGPSLLEVNVVDPYTNQAIKGFPAKQDLTDVSDFEIPLSGDQARRARHALRGDPLAFLTYVNLVVRLGASE